MLKFFLNSCRTTLPVPQRHARRSVGRFGPPIRPSRPVARPGRL